MKDTTGVVIGAVIYYAILTVAMLILGSDYTQLIVAVLFVLVLVFDSGLIGRSVRKLFGRKGKLSGKAPPDGNAADAAESQPGSGIADDGAADLESKQ